MCQARIGDLRGSELEVAKRTQALQMDEPAVCDLGGTQVEAVEPGEFSQMRQATVGNMGSADAQDLKVA